MVMQRNLPSRGFRPSVMLAGMGLLMTYGFYRVGQGIREQKYEYPSQSDTERWIRRYDRTGKLTATPASSPERRCGPESTSSQH